MKSFDLRETFTPISMLEAVNHFSRMAVGDEIEVIGDDAETCRDLKRILQASSDVSVFEDCVGLHGKFRIKLRKTKPSVQKHSVMHSGPFAVTTVKEAYDENDRRQQTAGRKNQ